MNQNSKKQTEEGGTREVAERGTVQSNDDVVEKGVYQGIFIRKPLLQRSPTRPRSSSLPEIQPMISDLKQVLRTPGSSGKRQREEEEP